MPVHCVQVLKIVSDNCTGARIAKDKAESLIEMNMPDISRWIEDLHAAAEAPDIFVPDERELMDAVSLRLRLTASMSRNMKDACRKRKIKKQGVTDILNGFTGAQSRDIVERKALYGRLLRNLLG